MCRPRTKARAWSSSIITSPRWCVGGDLKSGDTVHFHGHGTVEKSETRSSPDGDRHSATVRFHHGGVEHEPIDRAEKESKSLRGDIEKAASDKEVKEPKGGKY